MKSIGEELSATVSGLSLQFSLILHELHGGAFPVALLMLGDICVMLSNTRYMRDAEQHKNKPSAAVTTVKLDGMRGGYR